MSLLPTTTPKEIGLKKKRIELLTNKVQPNFLKEFKKLGVIVDSVISDEKTLESYFVVRLAPRAKPDDTLVMEIKNKIFSTGRFLINGLTSYSFKVSIALSSIEDGFNFSPLVIDSSSLESAIISNPNLEKKNESAISISKNEKNMTDNQTLDFKGSIKKFLESCKLKGTYINILPSEDGSKYTVNFKEKKHATILFKKRLEYGEEGLISMRPDSKSVIFFKTLPSIKTEGITEDPKGKRRGRPRKDPPVETNSLEPTPFKTIPKKERLFKEAIEYISKYVSELNSSFVEKVWENMEKKYGTGFELLARVRSKETEQITVISKKDFISFAD